MHAGWMKRLAVGAAGALAFSATAQAATPIRGFVSSQVFVNYGGADGTTSDAASWLFTPAPLSVSRGVASGAPNVEAAQTVSASFSADAGQVGIDSAWSFSGPFGPSQAASISGFPNWSYTFQADGDGTFRLTYDIGYTGLPGGLLGFNIGWTGPGGGLDLLNAADPTAAGVFERSIQAGEVYLVTVTQGSIIQDSGLNLAASLRGDFAYRITEQPAGGVPEPQTWALMILGFGGAGAVIRRRRSAA